MRPLCSRPTSIVRCIALIALAIALSPNTGANSQAPPPATNASTDSVLTLISGTTPVYPDKALAAHTESTVEFSATISKKGEISSLKFAKADEIFRESAFDSVAQWRYEPFLKNGVPIDVAATITLHYSFNAAGEPQVQTKQHLDLNAVPMRIGSNVTAPRVTFQVTPTFSEEERKVKRKGEVLVSLWVDEKGKPVQVQVVRGLGNSLDQKSVEAVEQYKFSPAMQDGVPVLVKLNIAVNFQIF
jgi:TonB family protein